MTYEGSRKSATAGLPSNASLLTHSLADFSNQELIQFHLQPNEWFVRHARRILQERSSVAATRREIADGLLKDYRSQSNLVNRLRLIFTLHAIGAEPPGGWKVCSRIRMIMFVPGPCVF